MHEDEAGLIQMRQNPRDGRSKCVWLTEAGRQFRQDAIAVLTPDMAGIAKEMSLRRIAEALPVLTEIRDYLDGARD